MVQVKIDEVTAELELMIGICHFFRLSWEELLRMKIPTYWMYREEYLKYLVEMEKKKQEQKKYKR